MRLPLLSLFFECLGFYFVAVGIFPSSVCDLGTLMEPLVASEPFLEEGGVEVLAEVWGNGGTFSRGWWGCGRLILDS